MGIIALAAIAVAYLLIAKPFNRNLTDTGTTRPANSVDYGPPSDEQKAAGDVQKEEIIKQSEQGTPSGGSQQNSSTLTVTISRAGQAGAGQAVNVRVFVTGVGSGECTFTFSKQGQNSVIKTAPVSYEATNATCAADIPASDFGSSGDWKLTAKAVNSVSEASAEQTVGVTK